jgi:hypothetical protein
MKTPERTWLALLLLLSCGAAMVTLCALVSSGRPLAVAAGIDLDAGTLLNASPRKAALLLQLGLLLSVVASLISTWLMRAERRWILIATLLTAQPTILLPPLMLGSATNPALANLSERIEVSMVDWPLWPAWSDPAASLRQGTDWATFQRNANAWVNAHQADLTLPSVLDGDPTTRRTLAYMHLVSQLWAPGNLHRRDREGCVRSNEDGQWRFVSDADIDVTTYLKSRIGCCDDYAHMLVWLLQQEGIRSRLVVAGGHIFVEAWLRGAWRMVDANTNAYADHAFAQFSRPDGQLRVMLANHPATVAGHPLYRPHWTLDRWRLLSTLMEGGFTAQLRESPPHPFPPAPNGEPRPAR